MTNGANTPPARTPYVPSRVVIEPRVVIADDSAVMRQMISDLLSEAGCKVVALATNGIEAVAACRAHKPDVMTLDLLMPGLDGLGVRARHDRLVHSTGP